MMISGLWGRVLLLGVLRFLSFALLLGSTPCVAAQETALFPVSVSVPPYAYLVERIGGKSVKVSSLIDQGSDPHTFEPSPRQMLLLTEAKLYVGGGFEFERALLEKIKPINQALEVLSLSGQTGAKSFPAHEESDHAHGDPHLWLSPRLLLGHAGQVAETMERLLPAQKELIADNYRLFEKELRRVEDEAARRLAPFRGRVFYVFHPAFAAFADSFGLEQKAVEINAKSPAPRQLTKLIAQAQADGARVIFAQPQFDRKSAKVVASAINGRVCVMDPMKRNILQNYLEMAQALADSFKQ